MSAKKEHNPVKPVASGGLVLEVSFQVKSCEMEKTTTVMATSTTHSATPKTVL